MRCFYGICGAVIITAILASSQIVPVSRAESAELPAQLSVDREAAEESFLDAYGYFLRNRLWNALDGLDESIRRNVYFVDAYYLRSLALRRIGRYDDAIAAMSQYLEVRRDDNRAKLILETMETERGMIYGLLSPDGKPPDMPFGSFTVNKYPGIRPYDTLALSGMSGIGKLSAAKESVTVCDTLGGAVWIFDRNGKKPVRRAALERPAAAVPLSQSEAMVFQEGGGVYKMSLDTLNNPSLFHLGGIELTAAADAEAIDAELFAVADREGGAVQFIEMPSLEQISEWKPRDGEKLFEPVAVSAFGEMLAVADRGGGRVFVINSYSREQLCVFDVDMPRDVTWDDSGRLFVLNERDSLYSRYPAIAASSDVRTAAEGMKEAWSVAWADDGLIAVSVSGRTWWEGKTKPGREMVFGSISLRDPWIEISDGIETLMLRGYAASTFFDFIKERAPSTQVVWRDEVRPSRVVSVGPGHSGEVRLYSPEGGETLNGTRIIRAASTADVLRDIAGLSRFGEEIPGVITLDSRISIPDGQAEPFLAFLLRQGVRLDLWTRLRAASPALCRISRITQGFSYYTEDIRPAPAGGSVEWVLSVPLPPDVTTFGYPSDATLSLFSDIDMIRFADWIPIWPSLISIKPADKGVEK